MPIRARSGTHIYERGEFRETRLAGMPSAAIEEIAEAERGPSLVVNFLGRDLNQFI